MADQVMKKLANVEAALDELRTAYLKTVKPVPQNSGGNGDPPPPPPPPRD